MPYLRKIIRKSIVVGSSFVVLMGLADAPQSPQSPYGLSFLSQATAGLIVAPVRRTAVVTTAAVASSSANAEAAAAQANAQAAQANAATANANAQAEAAKAAAPPPVGSMTTTLPAGCAPTNLNGVDYQRCGATYYKPQMMGTNLVFVVAQP